MPIKPRDKEPAEILSSDPSLELTPIRAKTGKDTMPPKVTYELIAKIGDLVAQGTPLELALMLEAEPIPVEHWKKAIAKNPRMARAFEQRLAIFVHRAMQEINAVTLRTLPGKVWTLERRFPQYFSTSRQVKHEHSGTLLLGVTEGIRERASAAGRNRIHEPTGPRQAKQKRLASSVIDVEVTPKT